jgi:Protein of unknown function (DUF2937)
MLAHPFIFVIALAPAFVLSQVPEFMQQYHQRLGGAVDELARITRHFEEDSRRSGYDTTGALGLMSKNPERLIRDQATRMEEYFKRLSRLREQQEAFRNGTSLTRLGAFVSNFDRPLAAATYGTYKPALPMTIEGGLFAAVGLFVPYYLMVGIAHALRRRREAEA